MAENPSTGNPPPNREGNLTAHQTGEISFPSQAAEQAVVTGVTKPGG